MEPKNNRDYKISIRLNGNEKEKLELNASLAGLKISAYARHIISNARPPIHRFDKTMVIQVVKIGNSLARKNYYYW